MWRTLTDARFLTWLFVAGGLFLRVWHYLANHTIWYDESVLLVNVMEKDFAGLLGPLHHAVAAPPLFVWLLKLIHLTAGDVPYVWRLVPFAFSVLGLLVTVPLARRVLDPPAAVLAVGLVAVSDNLVWLGCCIKPYAGDVAVVAALLLFLRLTESWPAAKRLLTLAAVTPPLIGFSYTSMFAIGGVLLALMPFGGLWRWKNLTPPSPLSMHGEGGVQPALAPGLPRHERECGTVARSQARGEDGNVSPLNTPLSMHGEGGRGGEVSAWLLASAVAAGTLSVLYFGPMKAQRDPNLFHEWRLHFPNYDDPASIPWWTVRAYFGVCQEVCNPSGVVLGLFAPVGCWVLWKAGRREVVIACVGTFAAAVAAAFVKAYPLGQHRLSQFLTPAVLLLGCAGVGEVIRRWRWVGVGIGLLMVGAADGLSLSRLWEPWPQPNGTAVRRYVQDHRQPGDVVLSDDAADSYRGNYLYFFFGELKPLAAGAEVPPGGRAWVVMDHHGPEVRRHYINERLAPLGFELVEATEYGLPSNPHAQAAAYLYVRRK